MIAQIARNHLTENASKAVDRVVAHFSEHGGFPMATDIVEASCWLDDLKGFHQGSFNNWHFIDQPYYYNLDSKMEIDTLSKTHNKTSVVNDDMNRESYTFSKEAEVRPSASFISPTQIHVNTTSSFAYSHHQESANNLPILTVSEENIRVKLLSMVRSIAYPRHLPPYIIEMALMHIIHLMGDIHQPLHCTTLVSPHFPFGDRGGNEIEVRADGVKTNLHSLWDSLCEVHLPSVKRPLSENGRLQIQSWVTKLEERYAARVSHLVDGPFHFSPKTYALESTAFAINTSYDPLEPGLLRSTPTASSSRHQTQKGRVLYHSVQGLDGLSDGHPTHSRNNNNEDDEEVFTSMSGANPNRKREESNRKLASWDKKIDGDLLVSEDIANGKESQTNTGDTATAKPAGEDIVVLSDRYLKKCRSVARQRIVLAGLRLAQLLNRIFEDGIPAAYENL